MINLMEFWIIRDGIPLFHQKTNNVKSINKSLVSGFISAFNSMVATKSENIESIKFADSKLVLERVELKRLFFIGRTIQKEKDKNIRKELQKISALFLKLYETEIDDWTGDISVFDNFREQISSYFS
ncbi:MAG: hypothetical protein ACTSWY_14740 [Promethearchaeota archaeon]